MGKARTNKKGSVKLPSFANNTPINGALQQRYDYIPIDYIHCEVLGLCHDYFEQNVLLTRWSKKKEKKDYRIIYSKWNMKVVVHVESKTNRITLSGSLHKFVNMGEHNHDQFSYERYLESLRLLNEYFGIKPENLKIIGIEIGFNIEPPIETNKILNNIFINKKRVFQDGMDRPGARYIQCGDPKNYLLKIYNKGLQYKVKRNILRIEKKYARWDKFRKQGICTLKDFNRVSKNIFLLELLDHWNDTVFYDPTNKGIKEWHKYSNKTYWKEKTSIRSNNFTKHRKRLKEINKTHGLNVQKLINDEIIKTVYKLQGVRNYNFIKERRFCVLTGIEITMQKKESFLLSHSGLYYLLKHDPERFERVKNKFLTQHWLTSSIKVQVKEIAHVIRSRYNHQLSRYPTYQTSLFDISKGKELQVYI